MRKILFCGKRYDTLEWITGFIWQDWADLWYIRVQIMMGQGRKYADYEVDPDTIGQYTGLLDKNGAMVFEGDIVRFCHPSPDVVDGDGVVMWNPDEMAWEFRDSAPGSGDWYNGYGGEFYEVIGNVFDNPELLEVHND